MNIQTATSGAGLWSDESRRVKITRLSIAYLNNETLLDSDFGELRAYFDPTAWNVDEFGLIYTDPGWIQSFRTELMRLGFSADAVDELDYSEQGIQGRNFVSLDINGSEFFRQNDPLLQFVEGADQLRATVERE